MKKQALVFVLFAVLVCLSMGAAQAGTISVPVKGVIAANGSVQLTFSFYGRAVGGNELFSVTKTLPVSSNIYFGMVEVPDSVFQGRERVFFEVARPSAPAIPLGERAQFTNRDPGAPNRTVTLLGCSQCFTCGGSFPVFSGAFNTAASPQVNERGSSCSGAATVARTDVRPFLCCQ
jgi:hypothetical protein